MGCSRGVSLLHRIAVCQTWLLQLAVGPGALGAQSISGNQSRQPAWEENSGKQNIFGLNHANYSLDMDLGSWCWSTRPRPFAPLPLVFKGCLVSYSSIHRNRPYKVSQR